MLEELSIFVDFVSRFRLLLFDCQVVAVVERESWFISCFGMLNDRQVVSDISLTRSQSVSIVVKLQNLSFFKAQKCTSRMSQKCLNWIYLRMCDSSRRITDSISYKISKLLFSPRCDQHYFITILYHPNPINFSHCPHTLQCWYYLMYYFIPFHTSDTIPIDSK